MSVPIPRLKRLEVQVDRVVQAGASSGQEVQAYVAAGISRALLVEPLDQPYAALEEAVAPLPGYTAVQAVCASRDGERVTLHRASNAGESSSILEPARHLAAHPGITFDERIEMRARRLDSIAREHGFLDRDASPLLLVIDVQGAELQVLRGAAETLLATRAAWIEVSQAVLYEDNAIFSDVIGFLDLFGLKLMYANINRNLYGDALFVRLRC